MRVHFEKILAGEKQSFTCREFNSRVFTAPFHIHPEFELTMILSGRGRRFVGDSVESFGPGDLVLLGPNLPHRWASTPSTPGESGARSLVVQFRRECFGEAFFAAAELAAVRRLFDQAAQGLHFPVSMLAVLRPMMSTLRTAEGCRRVTTFLSLLEYLTTGRGRRLASVGYRASVDAKTAARIDRVISHVERHFDNEHLAQPEAAEIVGLAPSAFSRFFSRTVGRTFIQHVNEVRLSHACRMLTETEQAVTDIAFACGFGTLSNFHCRFRAARGTTPLRYRRLFLAKDQASPRRFTEAMLVP